MFDRQHTEHFKAIQLILGDQEEQRAESSVSGMWRNSSDGLFLHEISYFCCQKIDLHLRGKDFLL